MKYSTCAELTNCISAEGEALPTNEYPGYDIKQSNDEAPVLKLWGMWSTPSLPLLPGPLWPSGVAHDRVQSMGQNDLLYIKIVCKQMTYAQFNC